ncbi:DUF6147 family protein [Lachnospiraceae bacterium 45-P1]
MKIRKMLCLVVVFSMLMSMAAFANDLTWENLPGHHDQSILLGPEELTSQDIVYRNARGEIISHGLTEITNEKNGELYVRIATYAHKNVDKIHHAVILDQWDDSQQEWVQIDFWEFDKTIEEGNGKLTMFSTSFRLTGYEVNKYYRVRGIHVVELGDEMEGCATETDGVKLTKR